MMKNATIDPTPLTPNEQLLSVVDTHNIKIILVGGPGVGKSLVAAKIMTALSAIMPDTEISLRETDQLPSETIKQVQMVDTVLPSLSKRVKKISIYTMQTNKSGVLKGVSRIVDKQDKP